MRFWTRALSDLASIVCAFLPLALIRGWDDEACLTWMLHPAEPFGLWEQSINDSRQRPLSERNRDARCTILSHSL